MKYLTSLLFMTSLMAACTGTQPVEEGIPADMEGKKAYLQQKRTELKELTTLVARLEEEIGEQDTGIIRKQPRLVTTIPVSRKDFAHFVEIQGSVQADDLVDATAEVAGRILQLKVKEGQTVSRGQLVAELDLEQLNKQIAELETSLDLAKTVYERQKRLWDQNIGSEIQYLEARSNKERLEKSLETLQFQLKKSKVFAPISGVVDREVLQAGELATPGLPIVQILNTSRLKVTAEVPENYLRAVRKGEKVRIKIPALDLELEKPVILVGRTINPENRTFSVEVSLDNPQGLLKPNLMATMLLNDFTEPNAVTVPLEVLQQEVSGKQFVFVKTGSGSAPAAKKVYVVTGRSYEGEIVITEGLQGEEELIMEGARGLADQDPIRIVNSKTEANNG